MGGEEEALLRELCRYAVVLRVPLIYSMIYAIMTNLSSLVRLQATLHPLHRRIITLVWGSHMSLRSHDVLMVLSSLH